MFQMKYHAGWSIIETYNLPVALRNWFYKRIVQEKEKEKEEYEKNSKNSKAR